MSAMDIIWTEFTAGIPDSRHLIIFLIRLFAATLFGAAIGYERQRAGKAAGLRTHSLVAAGTAMFILGCESAGIRTDSDAISRVIQGIITGIGFVGAGSIIKRDSQRTQGVTTSAGIWMTAAIGVTVGLGMIGLALIATVLSLLILRVTVYFEGRLSKTKPT